jgi:hypothetical protein
MENQSFVLKTRMLLLFGVILSMVGSMISGSFATAADLSSKVAIARFQDKSGNWVNAVYKTTPKDKLAQYRPSLLFDQGKAYRTSLRRQCGAGGNPVLAFAKSFPIESSTFNFAVGLSAGDQAKSDPAHMRHYVEQSYLDPFAHVSFAGFMLGNRAAANFFSMTALVHDPCRIIKRDPLAPLEKLEEKEFQSYMKLLAGPVAMSVGLIVSDELHQILTDPNIRKCGALQIGAVHGEKNVGEAKKACDEAYQNWVLDYPLKIRALVPDMVSMGLVSGIMTAGGALAKFAKGKVVSPIAAAGAKKIGAVVDEAALRVTWIATTRTLVVDGATVAMGVGRWFSPAGRVAYTVGTTVVFLKLNDIFAEPVKKGFETFVQGSDILKSTSVLESELKRVRANKWVFTPNPNSGDCDSGAIAIAADPSGNTYKPSDCTDTQTPLALIKQLGVQQKKWRDFIMGDTSAAASNWQDYVVSFANLYSDTRKFYSDILRRIWGSRTQGGDDFLNRKVPLWGVPVSPDWKSGNICDIPADTTGQLFAYAALEVQKQLEEEQRNSIELVSMKPTMGWDGKMIHPNLNVKILKHPRFAIGTPDHYDVAQLEMMKEGFMAMNCALPLSNVARDLHKDPKLATPGEIEHLRWTRYNKAISALFWELMGNRDMSAHSDGRMPIDDPAYEDVAAGNMYMRVNLILGGPEPMFAGATYVKNTRNDETDINKDLRDLHPMELRGVATKQMPDYLLASMVCGPTAGQAITKTTIKGKEVKAFGQTYQIMGQDWSVNFEPPRIVPDLGYDLCKDRAFAQGVMLSNSKTPILGAYVPVADPYLTVWNVKGKAYRGLLDVVKSNVSTEIIGAGSTFMFPQWWSTNFGKKAEALFKTFRMRFVHDVIEKTFFPALANPEYSTDKHWLIANSKGLPKGLNNAMLDLVKQHLAMIEPMVIHPGSKAEDVAKFHELSATLQRHLSIGLKMIAPPLKNLKPAIKMYVESPDVEFKGTWSDEDVSMKQAHPKSEVAAAYQNPAFKGLFDDTSFTAYKLNDMDYLHAVANLNSFAKEQSAVQGTAKATLDPMIDAITENLKSLVTDLDAYHGFLVSVRLDSAG